MGAVCDVDDALTSDRPCKAGWNAGDALRQMAQWRGHFTPAVLQAFVQTVGIQPAGSLRAPRVKDFFGTRSNLRVMSAEIDLAAPRRSDRIVACEAPEAWPFQDLDELWAGDAVRP